LGLLEQRNLWALFVDTCFERRGLALAHAAFEWFSASDVDDVTFTTEPHTRADAFYARFGCERGDLVAHGDVLYT